MTDLTVPEKLAKLRELMTTQHVDALVVMSADPHMSEYYLTTGKQGSG